MNTFSKLSDEELESSLQFHVTSERKSLQIILDHIREVSRRELHLAKGFPDIKRYLMKRYGYSEPAARRRVEAANILKDVPALAEKIQEGSICLSVIGELNRAIKEKESTSHEKVSAAQKTELVAMISGKSVAESQQNLAQALDIQIRDYEFQRVQKDESVRLELTASKELHEKLNQCRDLLSHQIQQQHGNHTLASVIEILADLYLQKKISANNSKPTADSSIQNAKINKTLTPKTKREVLERDQCCQFKDPKTGQVCGSRFLLQTDHKMSQWAGGNHELGNLQILCANHNRHKYRKEAQLRWC